MRIAALLMFGMLSGCFAPGITFQSPPPQRVAMDGYTFDLYFNGQVVRGVRVNRGKPVSRTHFQAAFVRAVQAGLSCDVLGSTLRGDLVLLTAETICPN
ncbi:hypothetical protein Dshi_0819 [Dinoroseobacter shibae DFL 12 = DSM 16493]|jgi:hypothetical protein|uniref:Lipoprotein n=1 Tax=Dinoroseobacter shibae (strain DSM 16493 / NCIMB 14021 / DFL 12) TaxID=398580 RepID=A8LRB4_DINSH|nr:MULTISPECIES: hypothetical protein [Dinoroseobacter]ABV92564.1 hypothetical protein Dshi_0819 [Dinoroseobacter shibae DFL 12 = DSM 16493]MDD9718477.1 hypothetical protein [Dinoroseobacter sp. PD6]URF47507.1 hypothetical protein M8008_04235 [Dinoroseobacter shibae]URF51818.1 hypothetical protein M8007_04235 [Dinoroseobacter shibae]